MKVLFFDSSKALRAVAKQYVKHIGIEIITTDSVDKISQTVASEGPDFLFIEWTGYDQSMFSFIERLINDHKYLNIVVIVQSLSKENLNRAFRIGISDFLIKPFSRDSFLQKVLKPLVKKEAPQDKLQAPLNDSDTPADKAGKKVSKKVMIVDDSDLMRKLICKELQPDGYSFFLANNGKKALEIASKEKIDLVTLDLEMPGMNGYEVCEKLRLDEKTQDIPVIIVSAKTDQKEKEQGFKVGAIEYFVKPFTEGSLRVFIRNVFSAIEQKKFGRIAVVDQEPTTGHILKYSLKKRGFIVYLMKTGKELVKFLESNPIDIIISEFDLPDTNATDLFKSLGESNGLKFIPKIIITAVTKRDELIKALNSGADDYIYKPFDMEELFARVNAHLRVRYLHQELKEKNRILEELSITDALTGLLNRGYLEKRLKSEFSRSIREVIPLSVIMIDLDNFKSVNDTHGHDFGDLVLKDIAAILMSSSRVSDIVGRYGGEEFTIILPNTSYSGALVVAERVRDTVMKHTFTKGDINIQRTCSLGVCSFPETIVNNEEELLKLADNALYEAKHTGKNRVITAPADKKEQKDEEK